MNRANKYLLWWFWMLSGRWSGLMAMWLRTGHTPTPAQWAALSMTAKETLWWSAIIAGAKLRREATGERTILPPPSGISRTGPAGRPPSIALVISANPWLQEAETVLNPLIEWRRKQFALVESEYLDNLEAGRAQIAETELLPGELMQYRLRRFKRDSISEVAQASQQAQLAIPIVGAMYPFAEYHSREDWRVRPTHHMMRGLVAQRVWEGWQWCTPPCGWNCRCTVRYIARHEARQRGYADKNDVPLFMVKWPNRAAKEHYDTGCEFHETSEYRGFPREIRENVFPDLGPWMMGKDVAK